MKWSYPIWSCDSITVVSTGVSGIISTSLEIRGEVSSGVVVWLSFDYWNTTARWVSLFVFAFSLSISLLLYLILFLVHCSGSLGPLPPSLDDSFNIGVSVRFVVVVFLLSSNIIIVVAVEWCWLTWRFWWKDNNNIGVVAGVDSILSSSKHIFSELEDVSSFLLILLEVRFNMIVDVDFVFDYNLKVFGISLKEELGG